ncbi:MAG TPA: flagellar biosynthesis anti-sigma factor FlgM [Terracidiphilus sp.]|jgi:negative regulator of flagellin synthesis FlgM|nr:flagellar biosynthesis anti-sigma factor FlgM [Terracidiphilus sp.]
MSVDNNVNGLQQLLGVGSTAQPQSRPAKNQPAAVTSALAGDQATLSSAGATVSQSSSSSDVRLDKVASIQAALTAGTYNVPASAVAGKLVDALLNGSAK